MRSEEPTNIIPPGIWPVVPTPFDANGVDTGSLRRVVTHLVTAGVHGLWALGVGAEPSALSESERDEVARVVLGAADGVPVWVGVTAPDPALALNRAARVGEAGGGGVFARWPTVGLDRPDEVVTAYRDLVEAGHETMAYVDTAAWERSGISFDAIIDGLNPLWGNGISGVKLACADFRLWVSLHERALRHGLPVFTASGRLTLPALVLGGHGLVADDATVLPARYVQMFRAWQAGDLNRARDLQLAVVEMGRLISATAIGGAKYALSVQGHCAPSCRDAAEPDEAQRRKIAAELFPLSIPPAAMGGATP